MRGRSAVAALAIAGAATLTVAGCSSSSGTNSGAYSNPGVTYGANGECTAQPDQVNQYPTSNGTGIHIDDVGTGPRVWGYVWITCTPQPVKQVTEIDLWYYQGAKTGWEPVKSSPVTLKIIPASNTQSLYSGSSPCKSGLWQVRWSVLGTDSEGQHFVYSHEWSVATVTPWDCANAKKDPTPAISQASADPVVP